MTWRIVYESSTGAFVALSDFMKDPLPAGLAMRSVGVEKPDMNSYSWDPSTLGLVPRTPQRLVSKPVFIGRFTNAERRLFLGFPSDSSRPETQRRIIDAFRWYLAYLDIINLDDSNIVDGVNYLESTAGILQAGRSSQILS